MRVAMSGWNFPSTRRRSTAKLVQRLSNLDYDVVPVPKAARAAQLGPTRPVSAAAGPLRLAAR